MTSRSLSSRDAHDIEAEGATSHAEGAASLPHGQIQPLQYPSQMMRQTSEFLPTKPSAIVPPAVAITSAAATYDNPNDQEDFPMQKSQSAATFQNNPQNKNQTTTNPINPHIHTTQPVLNTSQFQNENMIRFVSIDDFAEHADQIPNHLRQNRSPLPNSNPQQMQLNTSPDQPILSNNSNLHLKSNNNNVNNNMEYPLNSPHEPIYKNNPSSPIEEPPILYENNPNNATTTSNFNGNSSEQNPQHAHAHRSKNEFQNLISKHSDELSQSSSLVGIPKIPPAAASSAAATTRIITTISNPSSHNRGTSANNNNNNMNNNEFQQEQANSSFARGGISLNSASASNRVQEISIPPFDEQIESTSLQANNRRIEEGVARYQNISQNINVTYNQGTNMSNSWVTVSNNSESNHMHRNRLPDSEQQHENQNRNQENNDAVQSIQQHLQPIPQQVEEQQQQQQSLPVLNNRNNNRSEEEIQLQRIESHIFQHRLHIEVRVQALNSLAHMTSHKQDFNKIWLILYYIPLFVGFTVLTIKNYTEFCNTFIFLQLCIYTGISLRNLITSIVIYRRYAHVRKVIMLFRSSILSHKPFEETVILLQEAYKKQRTLVAENAERIRLQALNQQPNNNNNINNVINNESGVVSPANLQQQNPIVQNSSAVSSGNIHPPNNPLQSRVASNTNNEQGVPIYRMSANYERELSHTMLMNMYDSERLKSLLLHSDDISNSTEQRTAQWKVLLLENGLNESDQKLTESLITLCEQLLFVASQSMIQLEIQRIVAYGENNSFRRFIFILSLLEDHYFIFINTYLFTFTMCYDSEREVILAFCFYFSIRSWLRLVVAIFSLVFMALAMLFYGFMRVFSCKFSKDTLKTRTFKSAKAKLVAMKKIPEKDMNEPISCIICYEDFKESDKVYLSPCCTKCYHEACIIEWSKKSDKCPLCRATISS